MWSKGFVAYVVAFLFHWSVLSTIAALRLWRAGDGQPSVARRRMRFLGAASALLTIAILLAGLGSSEDSLLSLLVNVLARLSAVGFILGPWGFLPLNALGTAAVLIPLATTWLRRPTLNIAR